MWKRGSSGGLVRGWQDWQVVDEAKMDKSLSPRVTGDDGMQGWAGAGSLCSPGNSRRTQSFNILQWIERSTARLLDQTTITLVSTIRNDAHTSLTPTFLF